MNRLDRTMGILLLLRSGRAVSATELAARFEVSARTVYRDVEVLSGLGVPIYADMGRSGGFRLRPGYFLPPITLGSEEAVSLLLGLILMRRLRVVPFPQEADFAERKLMAALPEDTRKLMTRVSRIIGFERVPADPFHRERDDPQITEHSLKAEGEIVGRFLRAILQRSRVRLKYHSPYRTPEPWREVEPCGILWDRDRWYLVGRTADSAHALRQWRSDRVVELGSGPSLKPTADDFDVAEILDRRWLRSAMEGWRANSRVKVALSLEQAERLKRDWYYGNAAFEEAPDGRIIMSIGERDPMGIVDLVRWLGPGAELLEPAAWREQVANTLREMLATYEAPNR
ncbi:MAG: helix-turn-helix transcriptional regulator [Rectinemataceae bacterium]